MQLLGVHRSRPVTRKCPDFYPHSQTTPAHDRLTPCNAPSPRSCCSFRASPSVSRLVAGGYSELSLRQTTRHRSPQQFSINQKSGSRSSPSCQPEQQEPSAPRQTPSRTFSTQKCYRNEQGPQNSLLLSSVRTFEPSVQTMTSSSSFRANSSISFATKRHTTPRRQPSQYQSSAP